MFDVQQSVEKVTHLLLYIILIYSNSEINQAWLLRPVTKKLWSKEIELCIIIKMHLKTFAECYE